MVINTNKEAKKILQNSDYKKKYLFKKKFICLSK